MFKWPITMNHAYWNTWTTKVTSLQGPQDNAYLYTHRLVVRKSDTNFGQTMNTPTFPFVHNFECDFVRMDTVNLPAKFEVRSFTRSCDNSERILKKTLCSPWKRRSRSFNVFDFGTNRKRVHEFLLVRNSNIGPILHPFADIAFFCAPESPHTYSAPNFGGVPVATVLGSTRAEAANYSAVKLFSKNSNLCDHDTSTSHTDKRTDDIQSQYRALQWSARAVKTKLTSRQSTETAVSTLTEAEIALYWLSDKAQRLQWHTQESQLPQRNSTWAAHVYVGWLIGSFTA